MNIDKPVACATISQPVDDRSAVLSKRNCRVVLAALALASLCEFGHAQVLPNDAMPACTFAPGEFAGWFATGTVTANGAVTPADSLNFDPKVSPDDPFSECDFHKWSERMFLHVTSPAVGGGWVFESPEFYSVLTAADGSRTLKPGEMDLLVRSSKPLEAAGQPGEHRGVLMAQNGSLVYYATQVNVVYAYFLTGARNGGITPKPTQFPIEQSELKNIVDFAALHGNAISDLNPNALVVEVKSAWVETIGLDENKYITINAPIRTYTPDPLNTRLTPDGSKMAKLALVGMHVVGSVKGLQEMVWSTFEHIDNTPMASYSYTNTSNQGLTVDPNPAGTWLFSAHNCTGSRNEARMHAQNAPNIDAFPGTTIGPVDTCRENAWGSPAYDPKRADRNTRIIAINSSILGMLPNGDVRRNYLLIGTTWRGGLGTRQLANTTLETFEQAKNCFGCHLGDLDGGLLSHIYRSLPPLFP